MEWQRMRTGVCQLSVVGLGGILGLLTLSYFVRATNGQSLTLLKLLIPLFLSLGVLTLGIGLLRSGTDGARVMTVGVSAVIGMLLMGVVSAWMVTIQRLEGTQITYSPYLVLSNVSIGAATGTVLGVYRIRLQQRTDQLAAEVNRLNEFAGIVAHDLRNPLHIAQGYVAELPRDGIDDRLSTIERAHARMERLIDHVLALSRRGEAIGEPTTLDIGRIATAAWDEMPTEDAALDVVTDGIVEADKRRLRSLFENLFRNAIEHGGAEVTVTVGVCETGFYVADDGKGIPAAQRERIFEGGFSGDKAGTGLGLAIVRQIADAHGWSIAVTDSATGGARFEFSME